MNFFDKVLEWLILPNRKDKPYVKSLKEYTKVLEDTLAFRQNDINQYFFEALKKYCQDIGLEINIEWFLIDFLFISERKGRILIHLHKRGFMSVKRGSIHEEMRKVLAIKKNGSWYFYGGISGGGVLCVYDKTIFRYSEVDLAFYLLRNAMRNGFMSKRTQKVRESFFDRYMKFFEVEV